MNNQIRMRLKSLFGEKNSVKAIWKLFYTAVGCASTIYATANLVNDLTGCGLILKLSKKYWLGLMIVGVVASFVIQRQKLSFVKKVDTSDLRIGLSVNDIFSIEGESYVIPTNTFFRTIMDDEYISPKSIQGRFQLKYFPNDFGTLDSLIVKGLENQNITGDERCDRYGNVNRYPVGTVSKVERYGKKYYFLAINNVNEYGKPIASQQSMKNIEVALNGLKKAVLTFGHCDDLVIPLIGTGRAAIKEATVENVFKMIVDIFVDSQEEIAKNVTICINPKDYIEDRADIERMKNYIKYKCEFYHL